MADNTAIEWADRTWNPLLGCERVSPGCEGCYAISTATIRAGNPHPKIASAFAGLTERRDGRLDWTGQINLLPDRLSQPLSWRKPQKVFVNSQSDLFHKDVPDVFIAEVFAVMASAPRHTFQLLTKRHARMRSLLNNQFFQAAVRAKMPANARPAPGQMPWPLPNVWVGVSVEDQHWADIRVPALLATPAAVRWLSCEPLLGPLDLTPYLFHQCDCDGNEHTRASEYGPRPDWIVVGGESGPGARPMHPDWARTLRDQCTTAGVPYFFKQWGNWVHSDQMTEDTWRDVDAAINLSQPHPEPHRVGKKRAGRLLDERTWDEYPREAVTVGG